MNNNCQLSFTFMSLFLPAIKADTTSIPKANSVDQSQPTTSTHANYDAAC